MTWLARTPQAVVRAHLVMMRRLDSEERLSETDVAYVARGIKHNPEQVRRRRQSWLKASNPGPRGVPLPTSARTLASFGMAYVVVPPAGEAEPSKRGER